MAAFQLFPQAGHLVNTIHKSHGCLSSTEKLAMQGFAVSIQVEWPEQAASQQPLGSWDPLAVQAKPAEKLAEASQKAGPAPLSDPICVLMGVGGAAALALAIGAAWLYMG